MHAKDIFISCYRVDEQSRWMDDKCNQGGSRDPAGSRLARGCRRGRPAHFNHQAGPSITEFNLQSYAAGDMSELGR